MNACKTEREVLARQWLHIELQSQKCMINKTCICSTLQYIFGQPNKPKNPAAIYIKYTVVPTWTPQSDALLLMSLTDAIVAITIHIVARMPVVQVHIGRAVGVGTGAELR